MSNIYLSGDEKGKTIHYFEKLSDISKILIICYDYNLMHALTNIKILGDDMERLATTPDFPAKKDYGEKKRKGISI